MKEIKVNIPNVTIKLVHKHIKTQYTDSNVIRLGKLTLCSYGYDYSGHRSEKGSYCVNSDYFPKQNYKTEEEAFGHAEHMANWVLQNHLGLTDI